MAIDRTAKVHRQAELGRGVDVGAHTVIGASVRIGDGTRIGNNVTLVGETQIGKNNLISHNVVLGTAPQSLHYRGEPTRLLIGDNNVLRELVTMNVGTVEGGGITIVGNRNYLMICSHVGHDCVLEDDIIAANNVLFGGHVKVERCVNMGGGAAVHQFVTIGEMAFVGGLTPLTQDVPPYVVVDGPDNWPRQLNVVGLRRNGVSEESIAALDQAFRLIFRSSLSRLQALEKIQADVKMTPEVCHLAEFLRKTELRKKGRFLEGIRSD
jgi:UDP-N-acetylglucosamine acyltransferase